jgi:peptidoglycan hydrolase CwlO-like protein
MTVKIGRNDPCHCGSGRKYKQCCLEKDEKAASAARAKASAEAEAEAAEAPADAAAKPKRAPKPESNQPWRASTSRGYIPRARTPRKVGGS